MVIFDAEVPVENRTKAKIFETAISVAGCLVYIVFLIGAGTLIVTIFRGIPWFAENVQPVVGPICVVVTIILVPISFFLAVFKKTRPLAGLGFTIASYSIGIDLWLASLIASYFLAGGFWMIVGLFFAGIGVVPVAIGAAFLHSEWSTGILLVVFAGITYGLRAMGLHLLEEAAE